MPPESLSTLGPFRFRVDPERALDFSREVGADGAGVPMSYAAIWIADPRIFDAVRRLCAAEDLVPVHESQSFAFEAPLVAGGQYDVTVALGREDAPPRLVLHATISTAGGEGIATSETLLRLVPREDPGAAS